MCRVIIPRLEEAARVNRPTVGLRGLKLHWDNARPHTSQATTEALQQAGLVIVPQPPYSPDLAPSDFFLFGYLKWKLNGEKFGDGNELLSRLREEIEMIVPKVFTDTFAEWERRLRVVTENGGEYIIK